MGNSWTTTALATTLMTLALAAPQIAEAKITAPDASASAAVAAPQAGQSLQGGQGATPFPAAYFADSRPTTAFDMILRLPGFSFDPGAQVRGFADASGNVLIDGERPTSKQDDLGQALKRIPADQVERIDLIRGGAPGIDMQGRTILANVIRKKGAGSNQLVATLGAKLQADDGRELPIVKLEWSRRDGGHSFEAALTTTAYVDDGSGNGPHTTRDGNGALTYASHLGTRAGVYETVLTSAYEGPLAGGKFRINGLVEMDDYLDHEADTASLDTGALTPAGGDDTYKDASHQLKSELGLHYTRSFGAKWSLETLAIQQLSHSFEHSAFLSPGDALQGADNELFSITNNNAESIGRAILRYQAAPSLTLQASLEGAYNTQGTATAYSVNAAPQQLPAANEHVAEKRGEAAFVATWTPSPKYTVEAGIRLEDSAVTATGDVVASKTLFYPKPRVVFTWSPDPKDQVRLRAEREVGQLDFGAFSASGTLNVGGIHAGNPQALPQQAWVTEAAYERHFWGDGDATLTLRHSQITDAVDRVVGDDPKTGLYDEGGNLPRGSENDLIVDFSLPLDRLGLKHALLKATGTWRDTQVTDPTTLTSRQQSLVTPRSLEAHFTQDLTALKSSWGIDYDGGFLQTVYRFDEIDIFDAGQRVTAFFEYKPTDRLSIRAQVDRLIPVGMQRTVISYETARAPGVIPLSVDYRDQKLGPIFRIQVRQAFG